MIFMGPAARESETVRAERIETDAAPEPRRSRRALAREGYDDGGGLTNPVAWRLHRDVPEPVDPWQWCDWGRCDLAPEPDSAFCTLHAEEWERVQREKNT